MAAVRESSLIGREDELSRARRAIGEVVVVQLLGPPGVGKSAIRRELVRRLFSEGRRVVEPADPHNEDLLSALAEAMGLVGSDDDRARAIAMALAASGAVLVLDDAHRHEKAVVALLGVIGALVADARRAQECVADVRVVLVSARALRLREARIVEVGPLAPPLATALFLRRAAEVTALPLGDDERPFVESIVRATAGLPRAIELAALRLRVLSARSLAAHLADARDTMIDSVIEHALDHATPMEVRALAALATFRGAVSSDDAEDLLSAHAPGADAEALLGALRDQSMIHRDAQGALFVAGPIGLRALREVGAEEASRLRLVHAAATARRDRPSVEDLRAALAVAAEPALLGRLVGQLHFVLGQVSLSSADLALLDRAHALASGRSTDALAIASARAEARAQAGAADALDAFRALLRACEAAGDERGAARALAGMADQHFRAFELVDARVAWEQAGARYLAVHDGRGALAATHRLAALHGSSGALAEAESLAESAASEATRLGDTQTLAHVQATLATLAFQRGEHALAISRYTDSAARARTLSMSSLLAVSLGYRALAELARGVPLAAVTLAAEAVEHARAIGYVRATGLFTMVRAAALAEIDPLDDAAREAAARQVSVGLSLLDGLYAVAGDLLAGLVDLAEARAALARGETDRAIGRAMSLTERISQARALRVGTGQRRSRPHAIDVSDDLRIVLAIVEQRAQALAPVFRERLKRVGESAHVRLLVAPGGGRFKLADHAVSLAHRPLLARLLWCLAQRALEGRSTTSAELVSAGWPNERLPGRAGTTRLYVALADLKKLGLRGLIRSEQEGYVLAAEIELDLLG